MPVDQKGEAMRAALRKKSMSELESLLAAAFSDEIDDRQGEALALAVLEVMEERQEADGMSDAELDAAWEDFQERIAAEAEEADPKEAEKAADTGTGTEPLPMQTSSAKNPWKTPKKSRLLRRGLLAAAAAVLLCGISLSLAFGFDIFQAIANWTTEHFGFVTTAEDGQEAAEDPFENLRLLVSSKCDVQGVPSWAPEGTELEENVSISEKTDRVTIRCGYKTESGEFTIRIVVYDAEPEDYPTIYQKDDSSIQLYKVNGITHYLMENNGSNCATWVNGPLEGYIQGEITMSDLKKMIDSIYTGG